MRKLEIYFFFRQHSIQFAFHTGQLLGLVDVLGRTVGAGRSSGGLGGGKDRPIQTKSEV